MKHPGGIFMFASRWNPGLTAAGILLALAAAAGGQVPAGYGMVWNDEFDGTKLDGTKWEAMGGPRRNAIMDPQDAYLDGKGNLVLRTRKVENTYHDGFIRTMGKYETTYGYF